MVLFDIATRYMALRVRSITGVAVMPISGETWAHPPTGSLGVSLLPRVDVFHKDEAVAPLTESASKA